MPFETSIDHYRRSSQPIY